MTEIEALKARIAALEARIAVLERAAQKPPGPAVADDPGRRPAVLPWFDPLNPYRMTCNSAYVPNGDKYEVRA